MDVLRLMQTCVLSLLAGSIEGVYCMIVQILIYPWVHKNWGFVT